MYDERFFAENVAPSLRAAQHVLPGVLKSTQAKSVIDVGCAQGAWLSVAKAHGCMVTGIDGFAPEGDMLIDESEFLRSDLTEHISLVDGFDLAMCLEVAEHLPESRASGLVAALCHAAPYVLFSAAIPYQHGMNHINEQWQTWWAALFAEHGYEGSCDVRWDNWTNDEIEPYYKANLTVYAKPQDLYLAKYIAGVVDVVHPGLWEYRNR